MIKSKKLGVKKMWFTVFLFVFICFMFVGCDFTLEKMNEIASKDKVVCTVNEENGTQVVYDGTTYQILDETLKKSELGGWKGIFRNIAVLDENYSVLSQVKMKADPVSQIKEIAGNLPEHAKYLVPFYNAFSIKGMDHDEAIAVHLFNGFYKAVPVKAKPENSKIIQYKDEVLTEIVSKIN